MHPLLRPLQERKTYSFLRSASQYIVYDLHLRQLLAVLLPFAKSLKCLESSIIHPGHVYLFWLAAIATVQDIFDRNEETLEIPDDVIRQIVHIIDTRFEAMCEGPENAVYKTALFLDPGM